jgi:hypothetical protein
MMDWKLQALLALAGGVLVLIVGAGYKSYKFNDLPSPTEGGITFVVGTVFTALLAFMGGFDSWSSDLQGLLTSLESTTVSEKEPVSEMAGIVNSVGDSMLSMKSWFGEESNATTSEDMMVGTMPF